MQIPMDKQPLDTQPEVGDTSDPTRPTLTLESLAQTMDDRFAMLMDMLRAQEVTIPPTTVVAAPMTTQVVVTPTSAEVPVQAAISKTERATLAVGPVKAAVVVTPATTKQPAVASTYGGQMTIEEKKMRHFLKFSPVCFYRAGDLEVARRWLLSHKWLHDFLRVEEVNRPRLSSFYLRVDATIWWTTYTTTHPGGSIWAEFRMLFKDEYISI
ncbi:hypothetical protein Syun_025339 [Stephania yunnanensis]|uniref:Uncharacterized protein n=1 Tax=Stephania yunnanensis TaxID=152371 RepID=A0AAP0HUU5_9MAGN